MENKVKVMDNCRKFYYLDEEEALKQIGDRVIVKENCFSSFFGDFMQFEHFFPRYKIKFLKALIANNVSLFYTKNGAKKYKKFYNGVKFGHW